MLLAAGTRLGPYAILAPLGMGGMGVVYRAKDTRLGREVAIKVSTEHFSNRFEKEARAIASLNHPNICTLYDVGSNYLVMELVEGPTLADRIKEGPVPLKEALAVARQIAEALEAAHENGIIHRDLKPGNVKIKPDGTVKVLDFGLAKVVEPDTPTGLAVSSQTLTMRSATRAGVILGTPAYMSPEQASGTPVDRRADIWSFGVVLWEMLTGEKMFAGETVSHTLAAVLLRGPDWKQLPVGTPAIIRRLLVRSLERNLKRRLADIGLARLEIEDAMAAGTEEQTASSQVEGPRHQRLAWAVAVVCALVALGLSFLYSLRPAEELHVLKYSILPPEKATFEPDSPAVSPDGRRVALIVNSGGRTSLWVRELDSPGARPLVGTEGGSSPFWSPNSRYLGFFAGGKLKKVDLTGGPAVPICDSPFAVAGSWSKNDVILFTYVLGGLFRVRATGGTPAPVTEFHAGTELFHAYPWFLPDGRHFLYSVVAANPEKTVTYMGELDSKARHPVLTGNSNVVYAPPGYLLFARDRTLMSQPFDTSKGHATGDPVQIAEQVSHPNGPHPAFFSASQNGILVYASSGVGTNVQLTWFDRSGKAAGTVGLPDATANLALSPDGAIVAMDRQDSQTGYYDLWLHDLARRSDSRFTFGPTQNLYPVWSPDGRRIAFMSLRDGGLDVYQRATSGVAQDEILDKDARIKYPMDWSRDGRYIIEGVQDPKTGSDIWLLPLFGDRKAFPYLHAEFNEGFARLSPNGQWLAYVSDESKRDEVYARTFPNPGGKWQVSANGGSLPVWSRDGKELFFLGADKKLMAVEIKGGANFDRGFPKPLFDSRIAANTAFDVSNGGRFLIPVPTEQARIAPIQVVINWAAELKK